jgi:hypothetical protein
MLKFTQVVRICLVNVDIPVCASIMVPTIPFWALGSHRFTLYVLNLSLSVMFAIFICVMHELHFISEFYSII